MNPQFEKNPKVQRAIVELYEFIKTVDHGTDISWEDLKAKTGLPAVSQDLLYRIVNKVNELLITDSKYMSTVHGFGKRILNPTEHRVEAKKKVKSSARIYKKAGLILASTDMDRLDEQEKIRVIEEAKKWQTLEHIHTELLKPNSKPTKLIEEQKIVFDLIGMLKNR